jgi:hypothetical protein
MPCANPLAILEHEIPVCKSSFAGRDEEGECFLGKSRPNLAFPQKPRRNPGQCVDVVPSIAETDFRGALIHNPIQAVSSSLALHRGYGTLALRLKVIQPPECFAEKYLQKQH